MALMQTAIVMRQLPQHIQARDQDMLLLPPRRVGSVLLSVAANGIVLATMGPEPNFPIHTGMAQVPTIIHAMALGPRLIVTRQERITQRLMILFLLSGTLCQHSPLKKFQKMEMAIRSVM